MKQAEQDKKEIADEVKESEDLARAVEHGD